MSHPSTAGSALIFGIAGQDGAYLAQCLLRKGYRVVGSSRSANSRNLVELGIQDQVELNRVDVSDPRAVADAIQHAAPQEIYNLAGQSSVGLSFEHPVETMASTSGGALNILEAIRRVDPAIRLFSAGSSECFGDTAGVAADEETPFHPNSPYAIGKAAAFWHVATYRKAYGLFACTGILFNHESPLRSERFVTQKIVRTACRIAAGSGEQLELGNIDISRDWGWAPEYVEAMWLMLQQEQANDLVIATGETHSLAYFVEQVFRAVGLDWQAHVKCSPSLMRPTDMRASVANPARAQRLIGWKAETSLADVASRMVQAERKRIAGEPEPTEQAS